MNRTVTPPLWQVMVLLYAFIVTRDAHPAIQAGFRILAALYVIAVAYDAIKALTSRNAVQEVAS